MFQGLVLKGRSRAATCQAEPGQATCCYRARAATRSEVQQGQVSTASSAEPPPTCPRVEKGEISSEEVFRLTDGFSRVKGR